MNTGKSALTVSQLNEYLRMMMDGDRVLANVTVIGELSNYKVYASGHAYFSLKDAEGQLKAVMFRAYAAKIPFQPKDGMQVIVHGRVSVYGASGQYQLYADSMQPDGVGSLALQFEQLKRKLEAEGLFDESRKRPIPPYPERIGIVTSPSGAAIHDLIRILGRRFPAAEVLLFPSLVQGAGAAEMLASGVEFFGMTGWADVVILGRGGGSVEDLWAFNDENLARTVANCPIPVISAVGHESDFSICDFVADLRAATPSAAAELVVPDRRVLLEELSEERIRLDRAINRSLSDAAERLDRLAASGVMAHPERITDPYRMRLSEAARRLDAEIEQILAAKRGQIAEIGGKLGALSPLAVLSRGYAAVSLGEKTITRAGQISVGDAVSIRFSDGCATARVTEVKERKGDDTDGNENTKDEF